MSDVNRYTVEDCADFAACAAIQEVESEAAFEASSAGHDEDPVLRRALHILRDKVEKRLQQL